jgi:sulfofructose kinase
MMAKQDGACFFLGGSSVDTILEVASMPQPDEKILAQLAGIQAGGLVANTACGAARLGLPTAWAGRVGDDEAGRLVLSEFGRFGVDTRHVLVVPGARSDFCIILLDASRERTILVVETTGGMPELDASLLEDLAKARLVYLTPRDQAVFEVIQAAVHHGGGQVAMDVEAVHALQPEQLEFCLLHADIIFTNRSALRRITGQDDLDTGANRWLAQGASVVVVTMGAGGAAAYRKAEACFRPGYSVPVVDTTGAGDTFHAAFLFGLLSGWKLEESLVFSNAAAALSVQKLGARPGLPTQAEVRSFLATDPLIN